jgi:hypothetical protein
MKKNLIIVGLAALLVDAYAANVRARKAINQITDVGMYFAGKCDAAGIETDDFDRIAVMSMLD